MIVRRCELRDVAVIEQHEPPGAGLARLFFAMQERGEVEYLVAWDGEVPVGSGVLTRSERPELKNLHVEPAQRGRGIGTSIIGEAELQTEAAELRVGVALENHAAARLYERLGFERTGVFSQSTYSYVDEAGLARTATEHDEEFVKRLR